jgi:hypothetical protein
MDAKRLILAALCALPCAVAAQTVTLNPVADTTLYENSGAESNGVGEFLFVGRTAQPGTPRRRALLRFDLSSIPADAVVQSASLRMTMSRTITGDIAVGLHRASGAWGEGTSNASAQEGQGAPATAGDATWTLRVFPATAWGTVGGDASTTASAIATVGAMTGAYTWASNAALVADVQGWIAAPANNAGWQLRVDEGAPAPNAKRFNSRQNLVAGTLPELTVTYVAGGGGPQPPGPAGIPALGPAGLALLVLALSGFAAARFVRLRPARSRR